MNYKSDIPQRTKRPEVSTEDGFRRAFSRFEGFLATSSHWLSLLALFAVIFLLPILASR